MSGTDTNGGTGADALYADTEFRAVLDVTGLPGVEVPALTVLVEDRPGGGWSGVARVNPRLASAETAFHTLLRDGLAPGSAVLVKLVVAPGSRYAGTVIRSWPSVVTSVSTRWWNSEGTKREAFAAIGFRDLLSFHRSRPIWAAFAGCSPGEMLGGVLANAAGGSGRPTREPVLPGMTTVVTVRERLRSEIGTVPYAIAAGDPMGYWLSRILGRLGVGLQTRGDAAGRLLIDLSDGKPSESGLNRDGGVWMTVNPRAAPSATNLVPSTTAAGAAVPERGALLDDPAKGGLKRFGRPGPVESVIVSDGTQVAEAEKRSTFRRVRESVSRVGLSMRSRLPGLLPGRVVKIGVPPHLLLGTERDPSRVDGYVTLFGANEWQVAGVSHVYGSGGYWNRADFVKIGAGWGSAMPPDDGLRLISGVVDDGETEVGEPVVRDRLGRIPVRFPFFFEAAADAETGDDATETDDSPWPPCLSLPPVEHGAGNLHGFVRGHRQGDWCRVAVVDPFYAEVVGFGYREDRSLSERVGDATTGMLLSQGADEWRGVLFRPDEELERELDDSAGEDEGSGGEDDAD